METRRIGSLGVSVVGVGCNNFGGRCDEKETRAVVDAALDAGITFFDTADVYGGTLSEELLGRALGKRRDEVVIATKFAGQIGDDPASSGASARWIAEAVEGSLRRLGTDRIDLYQQHKPDPSTPIEETLGALDKLVKEGKVLEIGSSNFDAGQIAEASKVASEARLTPFVSAQSELSLLRTAAADEIVPVCAELGLAFLPYFPLASGLLTGKYRRGEPAPQGSRLAGLSGERAEQVFSDQTFRQIETLGAFAEAHGHTLLELAIAWLTTQPVVASVIAGATKPAQVHANAAAADWRLTPGDLAELDGLLSAAG